jgi:Inner membrane component domain
MARAIKPGTPFRGRPRRAGDRRWDGRHDRLCAARGPSGDARSPGTTGWWLALAHLVTAVALALTIIGIPLALANLKLIPVSLVPLGRVIVDAEDVGSARYPMVQ